MDLIVIDLNNIEGLPNISSSKTYFINFDEEIDLKNLIIQANRIFITLITTINFLLIKII